MHAGGHRLTALQIGRQDACEAIMMVREEKWLAISHRHNRAPHGERTGQPDAALPNDSWGWKDLKPADATRSPWRPPPERAAGLEGTVRERLGNLRIETGCPVSWRLR